MWLTPSSTARRSTRNASSRSRGGPRTPGPGSCMAPKPTRRTVRSARGKVSVIPSTLGAGVRSNARLLSRALLPFRAAGPSWAARSSRLHRPVGAIFHAVHGIRRVLPDSAESVERSQLTHTGRTRGFSVNTPTIVKAGLVGTLAAAAAFALGGSSADAHGGLPVVNVTHANPKFGVQNNVLTPSASQTAVAWGNLPLTNPDTADGVTHYGFNTLDGAPLTQTKNEAHKT